MNPHRIELRDQLGEMLLPERFTRRGHAFFRVNGKDVLQVVKFDFERVCSQYVLYFGLFSMYEDIPAQEFTSAWCVPNRFIGLLNGDRDPVRVTESWENYCRVLSFDNISEGEQLSTLQEKGIPFLNMVDNQEKLIEALLGLDKMAGYDENIPDMHKYAPYMYLEQGANAEKVINIYLQQHGIPETCWSSLEEILAAGQQNDDRWLREFYHKKQMAQNPDSEETRSWMQGNYLRNLEYTKFCKNKRR